MKRIIKVCMSNWFEINFTRSCGALNGNLIFGGYGSEPLVLL